MVFQNNVLAGAAGSGTDTHTIDQSIRFNDDDSAYMSRTFSASNRKTFTVSLWAKRGNLNSNMNMFGPQTNNTGSGTYGYLRFPSGDTLEFSDYTNGTQNWYYSTSTRVFRDPSAWYHIVASLDTTNAVASERIKVYINGQREVGWSGNSGYYPTLNYEGQWNNNLSHEIGAIQRGSTNQYFDGYLAEIVFIDGTALDPSSFGEYNSSNIWVPKDVSGLTFGTNGFHIKGETASDLGNDSSGNNNDFTASGLASDDQQPDSPTNNHCTWNSIEAETLLTYSNGNLAINYSGSSARNMARSTIQIPASTDAFFEMVMTSNLGSGVDFAIGIEDGTAQSDNSNSIYNNAYIIREDGNFIDQSSSGSYGVSFTNTDVIGVWRKANGDLVFYKNGTAMNSGTPAKTGLTGTMFFVAGGFNGGSGEARFASSKWTNKPSGVTNSMALNTSNLGS